MKKLISLFGVLFVFCNVSAGGTVSDFGLSLGNGERAYLTKRDQIIKSLSAENLKIKDIPDLKIQNDFSSKAERALQSLEVEMKRLVKGKSLVGFESRAKVNLWTLVEDEYGFGLLDGLKYKGADGGENDSSTLVITSAGLFFNYLQSSKTPVKTIEASLRDAHFISQSLYPDASTDFLTEVPVRLSNSQGVAIAYLTLSGGDTTYVIPNSLYVGLLIEKTIFIVHKKLPKTFPDIKRCRSIANKYTRASSKPGLTPEDAGRLEGQGQREYLACFKDDATKLPEFAVLSKLAQAIVDAAELHQP